LPKIKLVKWREENEIDGQLTTGQKMSMGNGKWQMVNAISSGPIQNWQGFECSAAGAGILWLIN